MARKKKQKKAKYIMKSIGHIAHNKFSFHLIRSPITEQFAYITNHNLFAKSVCVCVYIREKLYKINNEN